MKIQESGEMYLETILVLSRQLPLVRSIDIVNHLGYSKPSVSRAVALLKEGGFLELKKSSGILLTEEGKAVAEHILDRHQCLTDFLMSLGVPKETAAADACRIEHVISEETFEIIKERRCK